ncbi:MAG TPA: IS3 family transposase [Oscillospiraceae bacterium]|nr:IS3 family transposase [Oscillospiraceae bacterium]
MKKNTNYVSKGQLNLYQSIETLSKYYSVYEICKSLDVNYSSYHYWKNSGKKSFENKVEFLQQVIKEYANLKGCYGAPKITKNLCAKGIKCSVSKVSRAMKTLGIRSIVAEKFVHRKSSMSEEEKSKIVNLIKNLEITGINQVWTTDITYIKTIDEGNYYLITYMDAYSRKIVAWNLEEHQTSNEMIETLKKAVDERNPEPGLIIHSDKGSQMRSESYREFISNHNFAYSYTSLNHSCDENAAQESFHASLKKECIYQHKIRNYLQAYSLIYNYIENFYNTKRIHSSINYLSPCDFEKSLLTD